jgi:hypothetical protein
VRAENRWRVVRTVGLVERTEGVRGQVTACTSEPRPTASESYLGITRVIVRTSGFLYVTLGRNCKGLRAISII